MKKFVLTVLAIAVAASPAFAQIGDISAYADGAGTSCNIVDAAPGIVTINVLHKHTVGATASQWAINLNGGSTMTFTGVTAAPGMLAIAPSGATDISIAYGGCVTGDFLIATVTYFGLGTSPPCSYINFSAAPTSPIPGQIASVECDLTTVTVTPTGQANINPDGTCQCDVAVNEATWGGIKALYR
jgi:hypothetical protein